MKILGIESSADETAAAIVANGRNILAQTVSSSQDILIKYGGIYPEAAARKQLEVILPVLQAALNQYKQPLTTIDAVAVTVGPGLIGSLLVGIETAKTIAVIFNKPIIPVNHTLAHVYANWLLAPNNSQLTTNNQQPSFPALCLIVSGGHTLLLLMKNHGDFAVIGRTVDDAAGEALDKTARLIGLPYPGGPAIEKLAGDLPDHFHFPRGMINSKNLDFSFSGFKTAVLREIQKQNLPTNLQLITYNSQLATSIAASIQHAVAEVLVSKTVQAVETYKPKSLLISGGVSANILLRKILREKLLQYPQTQLFIPEIRYSTDNAATVASFAYYNYLPKKWHDIGVYPSLSEFKLKKRTNLVKYE